MVLLMTAGCGSDDGSNPATTDQRTHGSRTLGATASSAVGSALNSAQQTIQDVINAAIAAAPITFDSGSSDLGPGDVATIKAVAIPLRGNDTKIQISTYARDADVAAARSLAKARGDNIAAQLEAEGIDRARVAVRAEANPTAPDVQVDEARIAVVAQ
ncbi:OmpA family protein [Nocardia beijingensis]|uniref:OmpA family protein n=1 Tax=Nocardia beijingensis TaxID=95162 RepID=UPI0014722245|nr:OmpA family protein [Nocardia beijingensis]